MPILASIGVFSAKAFGFTSGGDSGLPIGSAYEGGYFAGQISTAGNGVADYNLVIAPRSSGETSSIAWDTIGTNYSFTSLSSVDGATNTTTMVNVSINNPTLANCVSAIFCDDLTIGGYSDWYMPAYAEMEILYYNLKPTTDLNSTSFGANTYAVPSRPSNHTSTNPGRTTATDFISGGSEALSTGIYWISQQASSSVGLGYRFLAFTSAGIGKNQTSSFAGAMRVRAIRKVAI